MDSSFPMSQPSNLQSSDRPRIFVAPNGEPLPIFVESNGISDNRPRLIRTLRSHGANICVDVSRARIILVEKHSNEGRQFVRDWGLDPGKVILEVAWVRRCLEAGRALLENDAWGGCGNLDGTPLKSDEPDDDERALFTEKKAFGLNGKQPAPFASGPPRTSNGTSSTNISVLPTPQPAPPEHGAASSSALVAQSTGMHPSQFLPIPPSSSTSGPFPSQPSSQILPNMPPPNMPLNMPPSMVPPFGQLVPQSYFLGNEMTPQMMSSFMMNNPEMQQMFMNMMMQGMASSGLFMAQGWPGQPPHGFMQQPPGFPVMQPPQPQPPIQTAPPGMNGQYADVPVESHEVSPTVKFEQQSPRQSMSPLPTFTAVNESDSESPPPKQSILLQRGKKRPRESPGLSSPKPAKRSKSPSISRREGREKKHSTIPIEGTITQQNSDEENQTSPIGIFISERGEPMTFYLQVQLRNRQNFLKQVKKYGGKIIMDLPKADFIILDTQPGKERDQWMKVVRDLKRFALRPGFIEACLNSNGIVEEEDFIIEPVKKGKTKASPRRREGSVESEGRNTPPTSPFSGSRSPSPPDISLIMPTGGRCPYMEEELEYAAKLAEHLCRKEPKISINQIAVELARRAPRHSAASWIRVLYRDNIRARFDRTRQEALSEQRNRSSAAAASGSEPEVEAQLTHPAQTASVVDGDILNATQPNGLSNETAVERHESDVEQSKLHDTDLKTIVQFFANPPHGVTGDAALWAAITQIHTCHTASSWENFYKANQEVVNRLLREALNIAPPEGTIVATT